MSEQRDPAAGGGSLGPGGSFPLSEPAAASGDIRRRPFEKWTEEVTAEAVALANRIGTGRASPHFGVTEQGLRMALQRAGYRRGWVKR